MNLVSCLILYQFLGMVAMLVLLVILIFLLLFFCLMPYIRAMSNRWKHWDDSENDPRWSAEHFQFSTTSPKLVRKITYDKLSNSALDKMSNGDMGSTRGSRVGSKMGSRIGSSMGINLKGSFRNVSGLPRYIYAGGVIGIHLSLFCLSSEIQTK